MMDDVWRRFRKNKGAVIGLTFIVLVILVAILAPVLSPHDPLKQDILSRLEPPSSEYLLGTDELGRDVLSRLLYGARLSLAVGMSALGLGVVVGVTLGLISGYRGGTIDNVIMRIMDILMAFPGVLLAILIVALLGSGITNLVLAIGFWLVPVFARLVRGTVLALREREFIQAATAMGARDGRILIRHVLINSLSPIIVYATLSIPSAILSAAALSFLGIGLRPTDPEWGAMVSAGRPYLREAPHLVLVPGFAIFLTSLSFNFVGDALRDALDPKLKA